MVSRLGVSPLLFQSLLFTIFHRCFCQIIIVIQFVTCSTDPISWLNVSSVSVHTVAPQIPSEIKVCLLEHPGSQMVKALPHNYGSALSPAGDLCCTSYIPFLFPHISCLNLCCKLSKIASVKSKLISACYQWLHRQWRVYSVLYINNNGSNRLFISKHAQDYRLQTVKVAEWSALMKEEIITWNDVPSFSNQVPLKYN